MGKITIKEETMLKPITTIGRMAGVAYGSDIEDDVKNYKRGLQCIKDGHGRVLEFADVYFTLEGYSNRVVRELFRHVSDGLTAIQESTRYVDFSKGFDYVVPPSIKNNKDSHIIEVYANVMRTIRDGINELMANDVPKEDAQMLIPLGATTKVAMKKNMRNLMDMSRVRMCGRAYWEFQVLMKDLKEALAAYSEEWKTLCDMLLMAKCEVSGYCDEKFTCGRKPRRGE